LSSPIYSMTGFASVRSAADESAGFSVAIKSVNHRFLDLQLRLPSYCDALEMQMRRLLKESLKRGHIEVTLQVERRTSAQIELNADLLGAYVDAFAKAADEYGLANEPDLNSLLRIPGVMTAETTTGVEGNAELDAAVMAEMPALIDRLNAVRAQEGAALAAELRASMGRLRAFAEEMASLRNGVRDLGSESETPQLVFPHLHVKRQLVVDVPLNRALTEREAEEPPPTWSWTHASSAVVRRNATAMASACRCQSGASARKRARPAVVSL